MFRIITIPFNSKSKGFDDDLLNRFLLNKQIKNYKSKFFKEGLVSYWTVFIEYDTVLEKPSSKAVEGLNEAQKLLFERIRQWRKKMAEKNGIPSYVICTNKELNEIVKAAPQSIEALKNIQGIGNAKAAKYGSSMIDIIKGFYEKND